MAQVTKRSKEEMVKVWEEFHRTRDQKVKNILSEEYLRLCKSRLNPGGVITQWVPLYETNVAAVLQFCLDNVEECINCRRCVGLRESGLDAIEERGHQEETRASTSSRCGRSRRPRSWGSDWS